MVTVISARCRNFHFSRRLTRNILCWIDRTAHVARIYGSSDSSQPKVLFHGNACSHEMNILQWPTSLIVDMHMSTTMECDMWHWLSLLPFVTTIIIYVFILAFQNSILLGFSFPLLLFYSLVHIIYQVHYLFFFSNKRGWRCYYTNASDIYSSAFFAYWTTAYIH